MKKTVLARNILGVLLSCLLFLLCPSAAERSSLFIRDSAWENDSLLPFLEADDKQLVPISAFDTFESITVTLSETLGSLLVADENGYLSYNLNFGTCLDESGSITQTTVYRYGGELYVSPEPICEKFGLSFQTTYASDGFLAARLTDGSETLTFNELLSLYTDSEKAALPYLYNPTGRTVGGTFMYPVLLIPAVANIGNLLPLLDTHSVTFALSPSDISKYASVLPGIYAGGHTVAYYMDVSDFDAPAEFLAKMEEANDILFALTGKTSRIYISTEPYASIPRFDNYYSKSCRMNLIGEDLRTERIVYITLEAPSFSVFNFSLASDRESRLLYERFFQRFDARTDYRSMPMTESSPIQ